MPNIDIDGSVIVILSEREARTFYNMLALSLKQHGKLIGGEKTAAAKIARDLKLPPLE